MKMKYVCLECQREHDRFYEKCPDCGDEMASHLCFPEGTRYGCLMVMTDCPHCANPLPLNGPVLEVPCAHCQKVVTLEPGVWGSILEEIEADYHLFGWGDSREMTSLQGKFTFKIEYGKQFPHCPECHKTMKPNEIEVGSTSRVPCRKCDRLIPTAPAPEWLKKLVPTAVQLYAADDHGIGPDAPEAGQGIERPVVMSCPQCGAGLKITGESERILPCQFCDSDVYLPDGIWLKLHPARTAKRWEVRFEGGSGNPEQPELIEDAEVDIQDLSEHFNEAAQEEPTPVRPVSVVAEPVDERMRINPIVWATIGAFLAGLLTYLAIT